MVKLSILSWNINSFLMRRILLQNIINIHDVEIIMLQEVKISEINKHKIMELSNYKYMYFSLHDSKGYAGVAILSKHPLEVVFTYKSRVLICYSSKYNMYFSTIYMYNGCSETAPLSRKLALYDILINEYSKYDNIIIGGDLNICHDHECNIIENPYTQQEKNLLATFENIYTPILDVSSKYITWWDYRYNFHARNIGMGLDKFLVKVQHNYIAKTTILRQFRHNLYAGIIPSDHAPILLEIKFPV